MKCLSRILICLLAFAPFTANAVDVVYKGGFLVIPEEREIDAEGNTGGLGRYASATTTYSMKVAVSMPAGTAGASLASTQPSNTKISPCVSGKVDAVTFTLTYNANNPADKDVYFFLFNPNADGSTSPKFYMLKKGSLISPISVQARNTAADIVAATDMYLPIASDPGGSITETLLGGSIILIGAPTGTWQLVGIVADNTTVNFNDPTTWSAWDVGSFIIGLPWVGTGSFSTCP